MLFARDGFEATSATRIADAAGVSVGSLYEYFTSKDALIEKLIKRHCEHLMNLYGQAFLAVEGQGIEAVVDTWVDTTADAKTVLALHLCAPRSRTIRLYGAAIMPFRTHTASIRNIMNTYRQCVSHSEASPG